MPVTVVIDPDAWANIPVRITVGAVIGEAQPVSAFFEITPTGDSPPINPISVWPVPQSMLGGLNVASLALGAVPAGTIDPAKEALLYDGLTPAGGSFQISSPAMPLEVSVDLVGDAPVPVSGVILNPQTNDGYRQSALRHFEVQLSTDGTTFTTVLSGELQPFMRDQIFAFDAPVDATSARLRMLDSYDPTNPLQPSAIALGEFSVISTPGFVPDTVDAINLADPALGGHIVRATPQQPDPNAFPAMLSADLTDGSLIETGDSTNTAISWVMAFGNDRAALIRQLGWTNRTDIDLTSNGTIPKVVVEVATDSPNGPWTTIGTWKLNVRDDGAVKPFRFKEPTWARFVRLSGDVDYTNGYSVFYPGQITVTEAPTSDSYTSAIGAYGSSNRDGPYEVANPRQYG
ncbi:MAG TPA: hypothetical protein PK691_12670, partial [Thermomicrobiales bacterium]|nr:hypothetical protein [Thermomicrobiales bacterium]